MLTDNDDRAIHWVDHAKTAGLFDQDEKLIVACGYKSPTGLRLFRPWLKPGERLKPPCFTFQLRHITCAACLELAVMDAKFGAMQAEHRRGVALRRIKNTLAAAGY